MSGRVHESIRLSFLRGFFKGIFSSSSDRRGWRKFNKKEKENKSMFRLRLVPFTYMQLAFVCVLCVSISLRRSSIQLKICEREKNVLCMQCDTHRAKLRQHCSQMTLSSFPIRSQKKCAIANYSSRTCISLVRRTHHANELIKIMN